MLLTEQSTNLGIKILRNLLSELGYSNIKDFQSKNGLTADGLFGMMSYTKLYNLILKVENVDFEGFYFKAEFTKKQIIWHHSAGWDNARGMFDWWKNDKVTHVATSIGISDDGKIWKGFDEKFWAASIGCKIDSFQNNGISLQYRNGRVINNQALDESAVAVEICNWGSLTEKGGKFYTWANVELPKEKVIELNYKGIKYYEVYTDEEIKALKYWTLLNAMRFEIPLDYSYDEFFSISKKALSGQKGIFTHNSYRSDKTDVSPQPKLIEMSKTLIDYSK
jgi:hypothetical protein